MNKLSVLIIDDNDSIRLSISSFLEDEGYRVYDASSGEEGIDIFNSNHPDIVLTDIYMDGLSGLDVLGYIKDNYPETPVIIISGAGDADAIISTLRVGAWDYITKPIEDLNFLSYSLDKVIKRFNLEKENREKTKALKDTIKELKETQKELVDAEKMASLGYMVTGVAHEINTPLGVCLTSISFMSEETDEIKLLNSKKEMKLSNFNHYLDTVTDLSKLISDSLNSINNLVTNFKQLSVDQQEVTLKDFNLNDAIESVININTSFSIDKNISLKVIGDSVVINNYPEVINRIFLKLSENSLIHGFKNMDEGSIRVEIDEEDENVIVRYSNNGEKIPEHDIDKVFDPFFAGRKSVGSGLGLCIVYNLVNFKLGGEISCRNIKDGVEFKLIIPKSIKQS